MEEEVSKENETPNTNDNNIKKIQENPNTMTAKSCKGCVYHSSNARSPLCVGISRTLPGGRENSSLRHNKGLEISKRKTVKWHLNQSCGPAPEFSNLLFSFFAYNLSCRIQDASVDGQQTQAKLPICVFGIEALSGPVSVPAHAHARKEDSHGLSQPQPQPQPRTHQPARFQGEEFMSKFSRNAGLVAMGVAKNLYRVGNHIKRRIDGVLYPYRSRPK